MGNCKSKVIAAIPSEPGTRAIDVVLVLQMRYLTSSTLLHNLFLKVLFIYLIQYGVAKQAGMTCSAELHKGGFVLV